MMTQKDNLERLHRLDGILQHEFGRERAQMLLIEQRMQELEGRLIQARKLVGVLGQALTIVQELIQVPTEEQRQ